MFTNLSFISSLIKRTRSVVLHSSPFHPRALSNKANDRKLNKVMPPRGFKRSRALWDQASFISSSSSSGSSSSSSSGSSSYRRRLDACAALARAVAYELQVVRASQLPSLREVTERCRHAGHAALIIITVDAPRFIQVVMTFAANRTWRQWGLVAAIAAYYGFVRYMHEWLNAGPVVFIVTLLTILFTVGLGDTADGETLSAYSVFNRGVRLLGDINVDDLLAQHMGGAGVAAAAGAGRGGLFGGIDPDDEIDDDDDNDDGRRRGNRGRRRRG
jgi:Uncharacterized conserved domain (SAYSvFN)